MKYKKLIFILFGLILISTGLYIAEPISSILGLIFGLYGVFSSEKQSEEIQKISAKTEIEKQIDMYTDIAYSNHWNWLPNDVGVNDHRYSDYSKVIDSFRSYLEKVDSEIKDTYRFVVNKFNSGYKQDERHELWKKYEEVREFSRKKAEKLGNEFTE